MKIRLTITAEHLDESGLITTNDFALQSNFTVRELVNDELDGRIDEMSDSIKAHIERALGPDVQSFNERRAKFKPGQRVRVKNTNGPFASVFEVTEISGTAREPHVKGFISGHPVELRESDVEAP